MIDLDAPENAYVLWAAAQWAIAHPHLVGLAPGDPQVAAVVNGFDLVFALWEDDEAPQGVRGFLIRGAGCLDERRDVVRCAAVPCADEAAALRLRALYGVLH